jgi:hypothetical protein
MTIRYASPTSLRNSNGFWDSRVSGIELLSFGVWDASKVLTIQFARKKPADLSHREICLSVVTLEPVDYVVLRLAGQWTELSISSTNCSIARPEESRPRSRREQEETEKQTRRPAGAKAKIAAKKICASCLRLLSRTSFSLRANGQPTSSCRECHRAYSRKWQRKNRDQGGRTRGRFDRNWEPVLTDEQLSRLCAERVRTAAAVSRGS